MKALYSRIELKNNPFEAAQVQIPLERYLYIYENERKKIAKLKQHEKDFLFEAMLCLNNVSGEREYNLFAIPEAHEFLFYWIILIHSNIFMVFEGDIPMFNGKTLSPEEIQNNKIFFDEYLKRWINKVAVGKGAYLTIIKPEIYRKLKDWRIYVTLNHISTEIWEQKKIYIYACFFNIYYNAKLFFDELPTPYIRRKINGIDVSFNIYSFVHIYSRHYMPNMNYELGLSMNPEIPSIDMDELPNSILNLIEKYNDFNPISSKMEYFLFSWNEDKFILWMKYKRLNETKDCGFEVRSFYKCTSDIDLLKFTNDSPVFLIDD